MELQKWCLKDLNMHTFIQMISAKMIYECNGEELIGCWSCNVEEL